MISHSSRGRSASSALSSSTAGTRALRRPSSRSRSRSIVRTSKMNGSPMRNALKSHDENGNIIDDEAIQTFTSTLDSLPKDEWRARTLAFETLIGSLPASGGSSGGTNASSSSSPPSRFVGGVMPWYSSYTALRRLANPISSLLLNPRSSVVKHSTQHMAYFVQRVRDANPPGTDMCKYLLKDLLGPVLAMHGQTVNVIRIYAMEMMTIIIPLCRFKSGLPVLLEKLRKDKSRDVREACVKYLRLIIRYWSETGDDASISSASGQEPYLTANICTHIGNGLARALMDPAQTVRSEARSAFEFFRYHYPEIWNEIVQKPNGILSKDARLKKSIMNAAMRENSAGGGMKGGGAHDDEYNPTASLEDGEDYEIRTLGSAGSRTSLNSWNSNSSFVSRNSSKPGYRATMRSQNHVRSKVVATRPSGSTPLRTNASSANHHTSHNHGSLPPSSKRMPPMSHAPAAAAPTTKSPAKGAQRSKPMSPPLSSTSRTASTDTATSTTFVTGNSVPSTTLLERKPNENYLISNQLLAAHKQYIDDLMEDLRSEMNTIRDFETLLVKSQNHPRDDGTYGPSEDDILKYYEAVYAYLDKGSENCIKLRKEMERISKS